MPEGSFSPMLIARSLAGVALVALGAWLLTGHGPDLGDPKTHRLAGWVAVAAGVWLIPFLRRSRG